MTYTEDELKAVISALDLDFIRNRIVQNKREADALMNTFAANQIVLRIRMRTLMKEVSSWLLREWERLKVLWDEA